MPAISLAKLVDKISTGHGCDTTAKIKGSKQSKVTINDNPVAVDGDLVEDHEIESNGTCIDHKNVKVSATTTKVFINGDAVCRIGDPADQGSIITGQEKVMVGG